MKSYYYVFRFKRERDNARAALLRIIELESCDDDASPPLDTWSRLEEIGAIAHKAIHSKTNAPNP